MSVIIESLENPFSSRVPNAAMTQISDIHGVMSIKQCRRILHEQIN